MAQHGSGLRYGEWTRDVPELVQLLDHGADPKDFDSWLNRRRRYATFPSTADTEPPERLSDDARAEAELASLLARQSHMRQVAAWWGRQLQRRALTRALASGLTCWWLDDLGCRPHAMDRAIYLWDGMDPGESTINTLSDKYRLRQDFPDGS